MSTQPLSYSFRSSATARELTFEVTPDGLAWHDTRQSGLVAYADLCEIKLSKRKVLASTGRSVRSSWHLVLRTRAGRTFAIGPVHFRGRGDIEDRSQAYETFARELVNRIQACNPAVQLSAGLHWRHKLRERLRSGAVGGFGRVAAPALQLLRQASIERASALGGRAARLVGPTLARHQIGRANLRATLPNLSEAERDAILLGAWENLGRVMAEYAHLDRIWDYDPARTRSGRIVVDPEDAERMAEVYDAKEPIIIFGAHLANWELTLISVSQGHRVAALYRRPDGNALANALVAIRERANGAACRALEADRTAAVALMRELRRGAHVGMLADEHKADGVPVTFFGRTCFANPLLGRFSRLFDCQIRGVRVVRIPDCRFRLEVTPPLPTERAPDGRIDSAKATQAIATEIERWIRQTPEQWSWWMHDRWERMRVAAAGAHQAEGTS